ncbi:MAG TPA: diguanylate cyclase [Pseudacidobacterium sp.]|jgi:diguanylate cyclase (GGDEF)-like protein|nr:diguanylate cyclase [Pseudacidobacterium sp.]
MSTQPAKTHSILLADSDMESAASLISLLESWKYQVELLRDGTDAFKRMLAADAPSIAILDNNLPHMSGIDVIAEIKRRMRQYSTWLMLMSGSPDTEIVNTASTAGVDDFLLKPVNEIDLLVRLRTAERVQQLYSEMHEQMNAMHFQASHDTLTGLLNRETVMRHLFQETDRVQRMRTPLCMMLLDLDQFSEINHRYGYNAGDAILKELAQRLKRYLRSYDVLGRCGEDDFLIGLPGCLAEDAVAMAERLKQAVLSKPYHIHRDVIAVSVSIGIATSRGRAPLIVLREAERALTNAKLAGRNNIYFFGQEENTVSSLTDNTIETRVFRQSPSPSS